MDQVDNSQNINLEQQDGNESITDIQNYLQSFNKEIGEDTNHQNANQNTTFYIDTSQVIATGLSNSEGAQVAVTQNTGGGDANGYQTLALVPDSSNTGFVLIVQPTSSQSQGQVQLSTTIPGQAIITDQTQTLSIAEGINVSTTVPNNLSISFSTDGKIANGYNKQEVNEEEDEEEEGYEEEGYEEDPGNSISVYDFEENQMHTIPSNSMNESRIIRKETDKSLKEKKNKKTKNLTIKKVQTQTTTTAQYMCNYCNYTSSKRYLLSRHMKSHSEDRPHKCGICERGFKTMASLNNHVNTHTGVKPHLCKYCDSAFTTSGELVRHVRYRHTHEKPHRCTECDYASVELSKLKRHMRCHTGERPYQCQHCTYASPDTYKLKRHLRIHTGEKPYQCDICQARFTQSNSLKAHRLIHSGNKPIFKCALCPTTCGRKTDLRIHVQKLHTSEKPLLCKRCDQTFVDRYTFKIHLKSHEGEKCFKCDLCNYASISARHLESHMLIHTDQKPFMCDECDQSFRQKQLLKRHKNLYHNPEYIPPQPKEKTHECPNCSKAFRHKGNLMRHLALHDPTSFRDSQVIRSSDSHQLIDDEEEEEDCILPSFNVDETTVDSQTLHLALDQTQQILNGEQVVVFEVVQLNNSDGTQINTDEQQYTTLKSAITTQGKQTIKTLNLNHDSLRDTNYIIQLQTEDQNAVNQIESSAVIDETEYEKITNNAKNSNLQILIEDKKNIKIEKDLTNCFGFKDEDDEDEVILSMPAVHAR